MTPLLAGYHGHLRILAIDITGALIVVVIGSHRWDLPVVFATLAATRRALPEFAEKNDCLPARLPPVRTCA